MSGHRYSVVGVRGLLAGGAVWGLLAAPARAVPVGDPVVVGGGLGADVVFDTADPRYVLAYVSPGVLRGTRDFAPVEVINVYAEGPPSSAGVRARAGGKAHGVQLAHDPARNRFLIAYHETFPGLNPPPHGLTIVLLEANGTRVAGPTVIGGVGRTLAVAFHPGRAEYLVVHEAGGGLVARSIDANGAVLGEQQAIVGQAQSPVVAYRPRFDDYVLAWTGRRPDGSASVFAAALDPQAGSITTPVRDLGGRAGAIADDVAAIAVVDRRALVTWGNDAGVQARQLVGRRLRPARSRTVSPSGAQTTVAYHQAGEYLVLWTAADRERPDAGVRAIYGQHLTRALREIGPNDFRASEPEIRPGNLAVDEYSPALAADPHRARYLAAWTAEGDPFLSPFRLYARAMTTVDRPSQDR